MRKHLFLAMGALIAITTAAAAADIRPIPQQARSYYAAKPVHNWTGLVVGGFANYTSANDCSAATPPAFGFWLSANCGDDGLGGGFIGELRYQPQGSAWVASVRAMMEWHNADGGSAISLNGPGGCGICGALANTGFKAGVERSVVLGGTLGYAVRPETLVYLHAGWVTGRGEASANAFGVFSAKDSATHTGWEAGIGLEQVLAHNWSAYAEYTYRDLRAKGYTFSSGGLTAAARLDPGESHIVRFGLKYQFRT